MSKFLLNLLLQISKALVNSKIQFLIQKSFFLAFGPANLPARSAYGLASPSAAPSPQDETVPAGSSSPRVCRAFTGNTFSRASRLSLVSLSTRPHLSDSPPSPTPAVPGQKSPVPLPRASDAPRAFTTLPHHSPLLIPFKPSLNEP
jgi:hypothetical protein